MSDHTHLHDMGHRHSFESPEMAARAEREGEVMMGLTAQGIAALAEWSTSRDVAVSDVLDLGSGPGVGTCHLAETFATATVTAVDGSAAMLERATARAERHGMSERIRTRLGEFPGGLSVLPSSDVVWASMALHHVGDQAAALRQIRSLVRPGGVLALVESGGSLQFVPEAVDLGRPGLWQRMRTAREAWFADMRSELPGVTADDDYPTMIEAAGFDQPVVYPLTLEHSAPLAPSVRRFALDWLQGMTVQLEQYADPHDLEAVATLTEEASPQGILNRPDARLAASRTLYLAMASEA